MDKVHGFGWVLVDSSLFVNLLRDIGKCQKCTANIEVVHQIEGKKGLCTNVKCDWFRVLAISKLIDKEVKRGEVPYAVNIRTISAFREMWKGHVDIETFCGYMNMPPPMNKTTYQDSIKEIHSAYTKTAEDSMKAAALDLREIVVDDGDDNDRISNVDVYVDGTWQRRGFASLDGAVTVIGVANGKCLAYDCMTKAGKARYGKKRKIRMIMKHLFTVMYAQ